MSRYSDRADAPRVALAFDGANFPRDEGGSKDSRILDRFGNTTKVGKEPKLLVPDKSIVICKPAIIRPKAIAFGAPPASQHYAPTGGPIAYEDSNVTSGASATPPSGTSGWVICGFAWRTSSTTPPTVPSGWTAPPLTAATNNQSAVFAWRYHNGAEGSYSWTNASGVMYLLYSGCHATAPIGDFDQTDTNATTWTCPGKTLVGAGTTSWVVVFGLANSAEMTSVPTGLTSRERNPAAGGIQRRALDTNAPVSSFSSRTGTLSVSDRSLGMSIELLVAA